MNLAVFSDDFTEDVLNNIDLIGKVTISFPKIDVYPYPLNALPKNSILLEEIF